MKRGIYITANDRVLDQAIALLNSIRVHDAETPVVLIPYDNQHQQVAEELRRFGVELFKDLALIDRLSTQLQQIFGDRFFARPNQFRKQACWFGEFDQFLYLDTDIVVFERMIDCLNYLSEYDFICCDYQHTGGITNVFTPQVITDRVFSFDELQDIFNCGFWGARRDIMSEAALYQAFSECAAHPEYFDFSQKTSDQPIINYLILKQVKRRFNLVRRSGRAPGSWAGSKHFICQDYRLIDPNINQPLQYLHWAGIRIQPGCPYWDVWKHYRYLHQPEPPDESPALRNKNRFWQALNKIRSRVKTGAR